MAEPLTLRAYRPADRERVLAIHEAALRAAGVYVEDVPEPDLEDIDAAYPERGGEFLVGEVDGRVVATGAYRPAEGYIAEALDVDDGTATPGSAWLPPTRAGATAGASTRRWRSSWSTVGSVRSSSTPCRA